MDLTKSIETKNLIDAILKSKETLSLDSQEVMALDGKQPVAKAEPQENPVLTMFEKFDKGLEFDEPSKEEREAITKEFLESHTSDEPRETVDSLFAKAKKGEI